MSPIVAAFLLPEVQSRGEDRAVKPRRKLLNPTKNRPSFDQARHRLNDSGPRIHLHQTDQRRNGLTCHDAVRVQYDHVPMSMPPPAAKIGDIAALPINGKLATAIMYFAEAVGLTADISPSEFLLDCLRWVRRIAENIEVEGIQLAPLLKGVIQSPDTAKYRLGIFVVDGHYDRGRSQRGFFVQCICDFKR